MSFWLRESKQMLMLRMIPRWFRWGSTVLVLAGLGAFWYFGWYQPLQRASMQTGATIGALSQRNMFLSKIIQEKPGLEFEKSALDQKIQKLTDASQQDDYLMLELLLESLKRYGVSCKELKPLAVRQATFWQCHDFELVFKGNFKNIKDFMVAFFTLQKFVLCNKFSLTRLKDHKVKGELNVSFITFGDHEKVL